MMQQQEFFLFKVNLLPLLPRESRLKRNHPPLFLLLAGVCCKQKLLLFFLPREACQQATGHHAWDFFYLGFCNSQQCPRQHFFFTSGRVGSGHDQRFNPTFDPAHFVIENQLPCQSSDVSATHLLTSVRVPVSSVKRKFDRSLLLHLTSNGRAVWICGFVVTSTILQTRQIGILTIKNFLDCDHGQWYLDFISRPFII